MPLFFVLYQQKGMSILLPLILRNLIKSSVFIMAGLLCLPSPLAAQRRSAPGQLEKLIEESPVFSRIFTGFALYDPESRTFIYQKDADKHFTPASNTKIFTLYTALHVLGDTLPVARYITHEGKLILWGTGNPLFLHPEMPVDTTLIHFLRQRPEQLYFSGHNFLDKRLGPGWSWADYQYTYQVEKSPFPMYANIVTFQREELREGFDIMPPYFRRHIAFNPRLDNERPNVLRDEHSNIFEYNAAALSGLPFSRSRPYRYAPSVITSLLTDTLHRPVQWLDLTQVEPEDATTIYMATPDTLYRRLMQQSDNFFAEQLMLMCSEKLYGVQETGRAIDYAIDSLFADAPDELSWADGSGLSRYNLFTPRTVIYVLEKLYRELPRERLLSIFPAGGLSGTIEKWYGGNPHPYVFAKTGTLSHVHCLSGYVVTRRNKTYVFSFMHNNYLNRTNEVREEMQKTLEWIKDNL